MGLSPEAIGRMSFWQFMACADGWARAHDPKAATRSNDDDLDGAEALLDAAPETLH